MVFSMVQVSSSEDPRTDGSSPNKGGGGWKPAPLPFEFRVGELGLAKVTLRGLVYQGLFGDPSFPVGGPPPPAALLDGTVEAALVYSAPIPEPLPRLARHDRVLRYVPSQYRRYFLDLRGGTFAQYLEGFSGKSRSTLRRKVRKWTEAQSPSSPAMRVYRTPSEIDTFLVQAHALSGKTYQERLLGRGLPTEEAFAVEMRKLAAEDHLRGYLLFANEQPAAFLLCPVRDGCVLYDWVGYDPAFAALSPGTVLQYLALEDLFAEGRFRLFDFTEGEGEHKAFWARDHAPCADIYYLRPSLRNRALLGSHAGLHVASRAAVRLLDRYGVKARLKRLLRHRS